jgi:hypothetical protein
MIVPTPLARPTFAPVTVVRCTLNVPLPPGVPLEITATGTVTDTGARWGQREEAEHPMMLPPQHD